MSRVRENKAVPYSYRRSNNVLNQQNVILEKLVINNKLKKNNRPKSNTAYIVD